MRRILALFSILIFLAAPALAHGGKTDSNGGHYNRSTGEYHYHHGYPAHQHENGVCRYDFDDKTDHSSSLSKSSSTISSDEKAEVKSSFDPSNDPLFLSCFISGIFLVCLIPILISIRRDRKRQEKRVEEFYRDNK